MDHFYDNSLQSAQMRDLVVDFELLHEHLVLLGNQVRFNVNAPTRHDLA
jgi:von Willebrand factor A domain-containing protein 8